MIKTFLNFVLAEVTSPNNPFSLSESQPAPIEETNFMGQFFYMLLMLGILVAAVYFLGWFLRKMMNTRLVQMNDQSRIKVIEKRALSQKTSLYIIDYEGKELLIAETPTSLVHLPLAGIEKTE